jgi:Chaperone of endosialidase
MKIKILPTTTPKSRTEPKFKSARGVTGQLLSWASMNRPPWRRSFVLVGLILACFAVSPQARAVCQDACLANQNTVQGDDALFSLTTGFGDTAIGFQALYSNTIGHGNNAVGVQALYSNIDGIDNTAIGYFALFSNLSGTNNTAIGDYALYSNIDGGDNTAIGNSALASNTSGSVNTATGEGALYANTTGVENAATGVNALFSNTEGFENTATGTVALFSNTSGGDNTATGYAALSSNTTGDANTATGQGALSANTTGFENTATGLNALFSNTTGSDNIALGDSAGTNLTTGDNNIDIGNSGVAGESNTIRIGTQGTQNRTFIAGISGAAVIGRPVMINGNGRLGTPPCSARYKDEIKPMDAASEVILALKPVTFRYKKEIDADRTPQFGLIAEDVEKVNPNLVARDDQGKPYTVRYEAVNAMLLNEFLKEHRKVEQLEKQVAALTAGLQTVSAQLELSKTAPQMVLNNQ